MLIKFKSIITLYLKKYRWRKDNPHNLTIWGSGDGIEQVTVGKGTYGKLNVNMHNRPSRFLKIGSFCSIAEDVHFIIGHHRYDCLSTYPFKRLIFGSEDYTPSDGKETIDVGDDVWLGYGSIILGGVILGQGCIVGAGAIVAKNVPPYAIYASGRVIKYRFPEEIREKLLRIDFSSFTEANYRKLERLFDVPVTTENIDVILVQAGVMQDDGDRL